MRRAVLLFAPPLRLARSTGACWAPQAQRSFATAEALAEQSEDDEPCTRSVPEASSADGKPAVLRAQLRQSSGSREALRMRKGGRTPAILFSLHGNESMLLSVDALEMSRQVQQHGRTGLLCQILQLEVSGESPTAAPAVYPVLPRILHVNAVSDEVENVTLMFCPPDRRVKVEVPLKIIGEDTSPGVKRGGYINLVRRTIKCYCTGASVPGSLEMNVGGMDIGATVLLQQLALPEGVTHAATDLAELGQPICKIGGRAKREP